MQQWKFFRIPVNGACQTEEEFNRFLRSRRVLAVHREFVVQGESSYWALAVEHLADTQHVPSGKDGSKREKIDYREVLSPDEFSRFARLREWRKQKGQVEAVPVYTILTNEQMADVIRSNCCTKADLAKIEGIGAGRLDRYGADLLSFLTEQGDEAHGQSVPADS